MLGRRLTSWIFLFVVATFLFLASCGRSGLDELVIGDGGLVADVTRPDVVVPDGGACSAATCPGGCCDSTGRCRAGTDTQACGTGGQACSDCPARGFDFCEDRSRSCAKNVQVCNATTCADGCCAQAGGGGGLVCLQGTSTTACGKSGERCNDCGSKNQVCNQQQRVCAQPACGPGNCTGCCIGDQCLTGVDGTACGVKGEQCRNCTAQGQTCTSTPPGGQCTGTASCTPQNCSGCCIGNTCLTGVDNTACGSRGTSCRNCTQVGQSCAPSPGGNICVPTPTCGPQNCTGCCRGNTCISPATSQACGSFGSQCRTCNPNETCVGGACQTTTTCGPGNCTGCCVGNICAVGTQPTACGTGGAQCQNCAGLGQTCGGNGQCVAPVCGPTTCPNGCCAGNTCVPGSQDSACGSGGQACTDCATGGQVCGVGRTCQAPCSTANCTGCCNANSVCQPGFLNQACGSGGVACANCAQLGSICNTASNPRVCNSQQNTCPAPYASCPGGVTTTPPADVNVCSNNELANARQACLAGPDSAGCNAFFQFEQTQNPPCATCLAPFKFPFGQSELKGVFKCLAPFVSSACNRNTGCATDCQDTSCNQCTTQAAEDQCRFDVLRTQCTGYFQSSVCVQNALFGAGAFCNPQQYGFNYGAWLEGVGRRYCGP